MQSMKPSIVHPPVHYSLDLTLISYGSPSQQCFCHPIDTTAVEPRRNSPGLSSNAFFRTPCAPPKLLPTCRQPPPHQCSCCCLESTDDEASVFPTDCRQLSAVHSEALSHFSGLAPKCSSYKPDRFSIYTPPKT